MQKRNIFRLLFGLGLYILSAVISVVGILIIAYWISYPFRGGFNTTNPGEPIDNLETAIHALPDSQLKRNLFTILASEYAGDSKELSDLLKTYSLMKIEELENKDN